MRWNLLRRITQGLVLALVAWAGYQHARLGGGSGGTVPIDAFCPFGTVESLPKLLAGDGFVRKTAVSGVIVLGAVMGAAAIGRASFCGWLCPLGTAIEWVNRLGRTLARWFARVPGTGAIGRELGRWGARRRMRAQVLQSGSLKVWDGRLRNLRYVVLTLIVALTAWQGYLVFESYDPYKVLFHFKFETITAYVVLGTLLLTSLFVERFWCRYLCPLSAVISLVGRSSPTAVVRDEAACTNCGRCDRACGSGLDVATASKVASGQCTLCTECVESCPAPGALAITWAGRVPQAEAEAEGVGPVRPSGLRTVLRPLLAVGLFVVILGGSMAAGIWDSRASAEGGGDGGGAATLDGTSAAQDVKGRHIVQEVADAFGVSTEDVLVALGAPADVDPGLGVKVVAGSYGGEVEELRAWLSEATGR